MLTLKIKKKDLKLKLVNSKLIDDLDNVLKSKIITLPKQIYVSWGL